MSSNRRLVTVCCLVTCCNIAALVMFGRHRARVAERCYATVHAQSRPLARLPPDFLSFGVDTSQVVEGASPLVRPRLRRLAAALAPARLRLGGTMSDRLIFSADSSPVSCQNCSSSKPICHLVEKVCRHKFLPFFLMTGDTWSEINEFCKAANLKLLFSFNVLLRDHSGKNWTDLNALDILKYSKEKGYDIDWQLGNEPNSFQHVFNMNITPTMLAHDFRKLRKLLNHNGYKKSLLVGPDTTRPQPHRPECLDYMVKFLRNGSQYINARSWHQYYLNSKTATLEDFWNPDTFDLLEDQINAMKSHTSEYSSTPMWLTETSSAYGGGAPGLSDSFAGSPLWLDKLGLAARGGVALVVRQSLVGGNYSLVDADLTPLPDWWLSLLYKRLVGGRVLHVDCHCSRLQRMYVHCANSNYTSDPSAITIYAINLEMASVRFLLNGTAFPGDDLDKDEFIFRAPSNNRMSKKVLLNSWPLKYEEPLPELKPLRIKHGHHISMPPYSIGFWVIKNTSMKICGSM